MFHTIISNRLGKTLGQKEEWARGDLVCYLKTYLFRIIVVKPYAGHRARGSKDKWDLKALRSKHSYLQRDRQVYPQIIPARELSQFRGQGEFIRAKHEISKLFHFTWHIYFMVWQALFYIPYRQVAWSPLGSLDRFRRTDMIRKNKIFMPTWTFHGIFYFMCGL